MEFILLSLAFLKTTSKLLTFSCWHQLKINKKHNFNVLLRMSRNTILSQLTYYLKYLQSSLKTCVLYNESSFCSFLRGFIVFSPFRLVFLFHSHDSCLMRSMTIEPRFLKKIQLYRDESNKDKSRQHNSHQNETNELA